MREENIVITPYEFTNLLELSIDKKVNDHATARIVGRIPEELEDKYVEMAGNNEWISIKVKDEFNTEKVLFCGVIKSVSIKMNNNVRTLEVEAVTGTYLMDIHPKSRTFQNEQQTYKSIMDTVEKDYPNAGICMGIGENDTTKTIVVQYHETDWQFVRRLASHFNSFLSPEYKVTGEKLYFGMPSMGSANVLNTVSYTVKKDVDEYVYKSQNGVKGVSENDSIYYIVASREIYDLCQPVVFKGRNLYVYEITSKLEGGVLIHYYSFKNDLGFKTKKEHNERLIGASIGATVLDVTKDTVKVHISVDESQDVGTAKWFPYSTVYSSPDGTGWYSMPEIGDTVRVYFPDEKEKSAFVISAVHEQSTTEGSRSDPDTKVLSTKYGKVIKFFPKGIEITSGNGLYIGILDDEGIIIRSDKAIKIHSVENMELASQAIMTMAAKEGIELTQGEKTKITIKDDITLSGGQLRME